MAYNQAYWEATIRFVVAQSAEARRLITHPMTNFEYHPSQYMYQEHVRTFAEDIEKNRCCSEETISNSATISSGSDMSDNDSDIEIDIESIEDEDEEYFQQSPDNIPTTVLDLERKIKQKDLKKC